MDNNVVVAVLGTLLGVGGTGGIGLAVNAWRAHKKGKIEDDGTLIERLNEDSKNQTAARKQAEDERDAAHRREMQWMSQAFLYRMQLVSASPPIVPNDNPEIWGMLTQGPGIIPKVVPPNEPD
jgi:hypothetical protein